LQDTYLSDPVVSLCHEITMSGFSESTSTAVMVRWVEPRFLMSHKLLRTHMTASCCTSCRTVSVSRSRHDSPSCHISDIRQSTSSPFPRKEWRLTGAGDGAKQRAAPSRYRPRRSLTVTHPLRRSDVVVIYCRNERTAQHTPIAHAWTPANHSAIHALSPTSTRVDECVVPL
jgi:hypothetical protein